MSARGEPRLLRARALMEVGRYERAAAELTSCLAEVPDLSPAWASLADCRIRLGDRQGALAASERALETNPRSVRAWLTRCNVLLRLRRHEDARRAAEEALRLAPLEWRAHLRLAQALGGQGDWRGALAAARRAVELQPQEAVAHHVLGVSAARARRLDIAEEAFREALRLDPEHSAALNGLTAVMANRNWRLRRGKGLGRTLAGYADAIALDASNHVARGNLTALLWRMAGRARWLGALCALIGLTGVAASGAGSGLPPQPGELTPRLVTLGVILGVCGVWLWRLASVVPRRLHRPLLRFARRSAAIRLMAAGAAVPLLDGALLVAVPWREEAVVAVAILLPALLVPAATVASRFLLLRHSRP